MRSKKLEPVRVNPVLVHPEERRERLDGEWRFRLDPDDVGVREEWFRDAASLGNVVLVPGCWQGQGYGDDTCDRVWDFGLEARTFRATYKGTGWYGRVFSPPDSWRQSRIQLLFGGVHPSAEIWLNGVYLGSNDMPFVPFGFDVTDAIRFAADNFLAVRVHEAARLYGLAYSWQGNWSGIYRGVELTATDRSRIAWYAAYPETNRERIRLRVDLDSNPPQNARIVVAVHAPGGRGRPEVVEVPAKGRATECCAPVKRPLLWSPETPHLYRIDVALHSGPETLDALSERTGFVDLFVGRKQFCINGEPFYMRGTGDFLSCPETGSPDTNRDRWRRKLRTLREYGYNYVRCQSYVYGPEYYDAADEVGILVQSEMGLLGAWGGHTPWHVYQWPKPTPDHYPVLRRQWDLVVQRDVNHPSANLYCMSNEYGKRADFKQIAWEGYRSTKAIKPSALVIWTDGGFNRDFPQDFVNDEASKVAETDLPVIQHEFRWWSSLPDPGIREKYAGAVRPYAIEIAETQARVRGLGTTLGVAVKNSQRLQLLEAKAKMEACRRDNPEMAGICHFNAMDTGPSPQGVVDEFYERKLATPAEWRKTNGDTGIMCSLGFDQHVLVAGSTIEVAFSVSDFSHPPFVAPELEWQVEVPGMQKVRAVVPYAHVPFVTNSARPVEIPVPRVQKPQRGRLGAVLSEGRRSAKNEWDIWVFPETQPVRENVCRYRGAAVSWVGTVEAPVRDAREVSPESVVLSDVLDDSLCGFVNAGGSVILGATEGLVRPHGPNFGYVKYFFTPPANYGPYEDGQNATIIAKHPMLEGFPHDGYADFQFFRMIEEYPPLDVGGLGLPDTEPVIRVFHRYPVCHSLAYIVEYRVGKGTLVLCALGLNQAFPEARYLLSRICAYLTSARKRKAPALSRACVDRLIRATALVESGR
ncbi:MAG: Beta-galactosidase [Candidatus Latescibacteria bacterium ADurb.Bin168]|nr:MAG: Beta-galactosidase [Candidatus Latescibacteria bacterium ADurb.Bin168]